MNDRQVVKLVREAGYPGYSLPIRSMCKNPDKYGIDEVPAVKSLINGLTPKPPQKDKRTLNYRVSTKFKKREYARFKAAMRRAGFDTMQDYSRHLIIRGVEEDMSDVQESR